MDTEQYKVYNKLLNEEKENIKKLLEEKPENIKSDLNNLDIEKKNLSTSKNKRHNDASLQFVDAKKVVLKNILRLRERSDEMTGKKLTEGKEKVLIKIINKRTELKQTGSYAEKYSWKYTINLTYSNLSDEEKRHLLDLKPSEKFPIRLEKKNIHSIEVIIGYHQKKGTLPSK